MSLHNHFLEEKYLIVTKGILNAGYEVFPKKPIKSIEASNIKHDDFVGKRRRNKDD